MSDQATIKAVPFVRIVKLPACPSCGTPNTVPTNRVCVGCGGETAEPIEVLYEEGD